MQFCGAEALLKNHPYKRRVCHERDERVRTKTCFFSGITSSEIPVNKNDARLYDVIGMGRCYADGRVFEIVAVDI